MCTPLTYRSSAYRTQESALQSQPVPYLLAARRYLNDPTNNPAFLRLRPLKHFESSKEETSLETSLLEIKKILFLFFILLFYCRYAVFTGVRWMEHHLLVLVRWPFVDSNYFVNYVKSLISSNVAQCLGTAWSRKRIN